MNFRKFFRMTFFALNGDKVGVLCRDARMAHYAFNDYVRQLQRYESVTGWKAYCSNGNQHVDFEGGGTVRFVTSSEKMEGVDFDMTTWAKDEYDPLREAMREAWRNCTG